MKLKPGQLQTISTTINAVTEAESKRLFKSEKAHDQQRSAFVFIIIRDAVALALYDAGIPLETLISDIVPDLLITVQMEKDGYSLSPCITDIENC
jgi:hypothetical protein